MYSPPPVQEGFFPSMRVLKWILKSFHFPFLYIISQAALASMRASGRMSYDGPTDNIIERAFIVIGIDVWEASPVRDHLQQALKSEFFFDNKNVNWVQIYYVPSQEGRYMIDYIPSKGRLYIPINAPLFTYHLFLHSWLVFFFQI